MNLKHQLESPISALKTIISIMNEDGSINERLYANSKLAFDRIDDILSQYRKTVIPDELNKEKIIEHFGLTPLDVEGGYFTETYRSNKKVSSVGLGEKVESTAIYYFITPESFSTLHKVDQDEIFHFYAGNAVEMFQIDEKGEGKTLTLGSNFMEGEAPQVVVPRGIWQGTKLKTTSEKAWALLGCTVAPGFEYENFYKGEYEMLAKNYPHLEKEIKRFT